MKKSSFFILFLLCMFSSMRSLYAYDDTTTPSAMQSFEMNGIRLNDYPDFQDTWKLVTVRYRTDIFEQRFVYANIKAYAALKAGGQNYPNGAVFAKIGVMTEEDPAFVSSRTPSGAQRIQFMVRDNSKYADTGGWGYAVFGPSELKLQSPISTPAQQKFVKETTDACFACHQIVINRNYIFSEPAKLREPYIFNETPKSHPVEIAKRPNLVTFINRASETLPSSIHTLLPANTPLVRMVDGDLRQHVFIGTLGEIRPELTQEVINAGVPAIFLSSDETKFIIVIPTTKTTLPSGETCPAGQKIYSTYSSGTFNNIDQFFCN